jgi:hypothetical protein
MTERERRLIEAGKGLVAAFGHRLGCPVLNRPEWACGCGQADEHGDAMRVWREAVEHIQKESL